MSPIIKNQYQGKDKYCCLWPGSNSKFSNGLIFFLYYISNECFFLSFQNYVEKHLDVKPDNASSNYIMYLIKILMR